MINFTKTLATDDDSVAVMSRRDVEIFDFDMVCSDLETFELALVFFPARTYSRYGLDASKSELTVKLAGLAGASERVEHHIANINSRG